MPSRVAALALLLALSACPAEMTPSDVIIEPLPVPIRAELGDEPVWKLAVADDGALVASAGWELRHFRLQLGAPAWEPFEVPAGLALWRGSENGVLYFQSETGWSTYFGGQFHDVPPPGCLATIGPDTVPRPLAFLDFGPNDVAWFHCASEGFLARHDPHAGTWARISTNVDLSNDGMLAALSDDRLLLSGNVPRAAVLEFTDAGTVERLAGSTCRGDECLGCARPGLGGPLGALRLSDLPQTFLSTGRGALTGLPNGSLVPTDLSPAVSDDQVVNMGSVVFDEGKRLWASVRHGVGLERDLGRVYRLQPNKQDWVRVFESDTHLKPELVSSSKLTGVIAWDGNARTNPRGDPPRVGLFHIRVAPGTAGITWPKVEGPPTPPLPPQGSWWAGRYSLSRPDGGGLDVIHPVTAREVSGGLAVVGAGRGPEPITTLVFNELGELTSSWALRRATTFPLPLLESGPPVVTGGALVVPWSEVNLSSQNQGLLTFDRLSLDGGLLDSAQYRTDFNVGGNLAVDVSSNATWFLAGRGVGRVESDGGFALLVSSPSRDAVVPENVVVLPSGDAVFTAAGSVVGMLTVFRVNAVDRRIAWARDVWVGEGDMTNTNSNLASNMLVSSEGDVMLCIGTRHSQTPLGALVRLSADGQTASAQAFRAFISTRSECGLVGLRGVRLLRTARGYVCHFDRRARPEEVRQWPGVRAEFPVSGAITATSTRGVDGAEVAGGGPVALDGVKSNFTVVHAAGAQACEAPSDLVALGSVPVVLRSVTVTGAARTLTPVDAGALFDEPFRLDGGSIGCE